MSSFRPFLWLLLLVTLPQAAHAEFACASQLGRIEIGLIKNLPFTADVTFAEWQLNADGTHKQRNGPIFVTHIARDSAGKVIFRMSVGWAQGRAPENGYEATTWQTTICNLEDQSTTSFTNTVAYIYRCGGSIPGLVRVSRSAFQHPDVSSKIPVDTLGTKELASIQATGFRYPIENAPDSRMIEQWLSDSMEMVLSHTETDPPKCI